nr:photosynthetic NDH subunit of subcomplex B 3, chloroplastic [Tanacetum cinerariifolium]
MNCGGGGSCGTCIVEVVEGQELLNERTNTELKYLKKKPESWRLACQTIVGNKENSGKVIIQRLPQWKKPCINHLHLQVWLLMNDEDGGITVSCFRTVRFGAGWEATDETICFGFVMGADDSLIRTDVMIISGKKARHVPYRDNKLARLRHDSLGGNIKIVMIGKHVQSEVVSEPLEIEKDGISEKKKKRGSSQSSFQDPTYDQLMTTVTKLEGTVATLTDTISNLHGTIGTLESRLLALEGDARVSTLIQTVSSLQGTISTLESRLLALEGDEPDFGIVSDGDIPAYMSPGPSYTSPASTTQKSLPLANR